MAIYKGREVTIQNFVQPGLTVPDTVQVVDKDGQSYSPTVGEVQFTEDEKKNLKNYHSEKFNQVNVIKDADLKKVRDDADPKVIEERMKKQESGKDVTIVAKNAQVDTKDAAKQFPAVKTPQSQAPSKQPPANTTVAPSRIK